MVSWYRYLSPSIAVTRLENIFSTTETNRDSLHWQSLSVLEFSIKRLRNNNIGILSSIRARHSDHHPLLSLYHLHGAATQLNISQDLKQDNLEVLISYEGIRLYHQKGRKKLIILFKVSVTGYEIVSNWKSIGAEGSWWVQSLKAVSTVDYLYDCWDN